MKPQVCVCVCESKVNILIKSNSTMDIIYTWSKINQLIPLANSSKSTSFVVWYHTLWNTICEHAPHCSVHAHCTASQILIYNFQSECQFYGSISLSLNFANSKIFISYTNVYVMPEYLNSRKEKLNNFLRNVEKAFVF